MLRISNYIKQSLKDLNLNNINLNNPGDKSAGKKEEGRLLLWNITGDCNLSCEHCYSSSGAGRKYEKIAPGVVLSTIDSLKKAKIKSVIISGGEPLMSPYIFEIARILKDAGFSVHLSTNGTMIKESNIEKIKLFFNYVGVSIDGKEDTHDGFRKMKGAFRASLKGIRTLLNNGVNAGIRFSLTERNYRDVDFIFDMAKNEGLRKVYISHLVYSGRGKNSWDLNKSLHKEISLYIIEKAFDFVSKNIPVEIVTGNNEPDAILLLGIFKRLYPEFYENIYDRVLRWGGNQSGKKIINIDYAGNVKPDPFFNYNAGNIKNRDFLYIINEDKLFLKLNEKPRKLKGRCEKCSYLNICNGGSRARAFAVYGDYFQEDPACFM